MKKIWNFLKLGFDGDTPSGYHDRAPHWKQELSAVTGQMIFGIIVFFGPVFLIWLAK